MLFVVSVRYTCAAVGRLILIKSQRAIHWPAARFLSLSHSSSLSLSISHSLCMFSLQKLLFSLYLYLNAAHAVRTLSSVAAASGRKTQLPTADRRPPTAVDCCELLRPCNALEWHSYCDQVAVVATTTGGAATAATTSAGKIKKKWNLIEIEILFVSRSSYL